MIDPASFYDSLKSKGIEFFAGVPDSLLKNFCAYIADHTAEDRHIITANEGNAVALASGYHLATGKTPLVYLQNSGLGNTVNPLLSLADREVYSIPLILVVGWRGMPTAADEPQHRKQGRVQNDLLKAMEVPYSILSADTDDIDRFVCSAVEKAEENSSPAAVIVPPGTFESYELRKKSESIYPMSREDAIAVVLSELSGNEIIVSTTGKTSREVYEYRERNSQGHEKDFLTVGSMGHTSQIALGISFNTQKQVICLDGDGSVIMHMGSLAVNGTRAPGNFLHIVLNNGAHDSVGGQPTEGFAVDFPKAALALNYSKALKAQNEKELKKALKKLLTAKGPSLLEVRIKKGARPDLGRPATTPVENKQALMDFLRQ